MSKDVYFWTRIIDDVHKSMPISEEPNIYKLADVLNYIKELEYKIVYNEPKNFVINSEIHVTYANPETVPLSPLKYNCLLKEVFYGIGYAICLIANKDHPNFISTTGIYAYFILPMLLPEPGFNYVLAKKYNGKAFDLEAVAQYYNVEYIDVIARARTLGMNFD